MYIIFTKNAELIKMAKEKGEQLVDLTNFIPTALNIPEIKDSDIVEQKIPQKAQISKSDIIELIMQLGVPAHVKGYNYLIFALTELINNPNFDENGITKSIYPNIAIHFETTSMKIERAIRNAIEIAFNRGNLELSQKIFGHSINVNKSKPTNSEFLYGIKAYLERELYED